MKNLGGFMRHYSLCNRFIVNVNGNVVVAFNLKDKISSALGHLIVGYLKIVEPFQVL
jgi:hypothetical protein